MRILMTAAAASALMLGGCNTMGASGSDGAMPAGMAGMPADMTPEDRMGYVTLAAASDMFEIQSSQMALTKAQKPAIRDYAQMMVTHHTQTSQQLTAAAQAAGMSPPAPMLPAPVQRMLSELEQASGANFDRVYMRQQVLAHQMALALHRNYAGSGDTPALRQVAAAASPIVEQHLVRARQLD